MDAEGALGGDESFILRLANIFSYISAMSACVKSGQWPHTVGMLVKRRRSDSLPDVSTYRTAISACEKGEKGSVHYDFSWRSDTVNCCPTSSTIVLLWKLHALGLLVGMRNNDSLPNCYQRLWSDIRHNHLLPDVISHRSAISACGKCEPNGICVSTFFFLHVSAPPY